MWYQIYSEDAGHTVGQNCVSHNSLTRRPLHATQHKNLSQIGFFQNKTNVASGVLPNLAALAEKLLIAYECKCSYSNSNTLKVQNLLIHIIMF